MVETVFYGLPFVTRPGAVFTPRPATEKLVEAALDAIGDEPARIADVGTGAGAIAVALAVHAPTAEIWATDISEDAVELAALNARRHGVADRVHVRHGNLLDPVPAPVDLVVANLPYLPESLRDRPEYAEYRSEPDEAIWAPGDGLGHYRRLLALCEAGKLKHGGGRVFLQYRGDVQEADCEHLVELGERLEDGALVAD